MAGVTIEINKNDLAVIHSLFETLKATSDNLEPALNEIGDYLVSATTQRFKDSQTPDGSKWLAVKRGGKPLVDHGHLRDSINYQTYSDSVEVGSNMIYAAIHQLGGQAGRGHMTTIAARPFLGIGIQDELEIGDILINHIKKSMK